MEHGAMERDAKIYVAGHRGMVGSALVRALERAGHQNLVLRTIAEVDLRNQQAVRAFFAEERPEYVLLAAAQIGGIKANVAAPAVFFYDNLMIQTNVLHQAYLSGVKKFLFLGSSCIYPRQCPQPMREEYLLSGELEPTNEGYALAKIAGLKMASYYYAQYGFRCVCPMPCNLYGTNDNFDLNSSHVLAALVRRFVDAQESGLSEVVLWGSGVARREFMHVDDAARAAIFLLERVDTPEIYNVGWGRDISIRELAERIAAQVGYRGRIGWDTRMPDGMPRKCLDVSKLTALGFTPEIGLGRGIESMIDEYRTRKREGRLDLKEAGRP